MSTADLHREAGGPILGAGGTAASPDNDRVPKRTPGPLGMDDHIARRTATADEAAEYAARQQGLAGYWDRFGSIVRDYLGIPYKKDGRAVEWLTSEPTGRATEAVGLVCTSFVDVVMSRYLKDDAEFQMDSYNFGEDTDIFDQYGMKQVASKVDPMALPDAHLRRDLIHGIVFHMKDAWVKETKDKDKKVIAREPRPAGSRIHVGFIAFHNGTLF